MAINRKDVRAALSTALQANITEAKVVLKYLGEPGKQMPAITMVSAGTGGNPLTSDVDALVHKFDIHLLVLAGKPSGWTEEQAEDLLDDVRYALDEWIEHNMLTVNGARFQIERAGDSSVAFVLISGEQYLDESVPVLLRTFYP